jgi:hypothetical protein
MYETFHGGGFSNVWCCRPTGSGMQMAAPGLTREYVRGQSWLQAQVTKEGGVSGAIDCPLSVVVVLVRQALLWHRLWRARVGGGS